MVYNLLIHLIEEAEPQRRDSLTDKTFFFALILEISTAKEELTAASPLTDPVHPEKIAANLLDRMQPCSFLGRTQGYNQWAVSRKKALALDVYNVMLGEMRNDLAKARLWATQSRDGRHVGDSRIAIGARIAIGEL